MRTSIQITPEEDREIDELKALFKLPSKRAVVLAGLRELRGKFLQTQRKKRLQSASLLCRDESLVVNREMGPLGTGTKAL